MLNKFSELNRLNAMYLACRGVLRVKEAAAPSKSSLFRDSFNNARSKSRKFFTDTIPIVENTKPIASMYENAGKAIGGGIRNVNNAGRGITDLIGDTLYDLPGSTWELAKILASKTRDAGAGAWDATKAFATMTGRDLAGMLDTVKETSGAGLGALAGYYDEVRRANKETLKGMYSGAKDMFNAGIAEPAMRYGGSWYHHPVTSLASLGLGGAAGYGTYKGLEKYLRNHGWDDNSWKTKALKWGGGIGAGLLTHLFTQSVMNRMADRAQGRALSAQQKFENGADALAGNLIASSAKAREANNVNSDTHNPNNNDPISSAQRRHYKNNDNKPGGLKSGTGPKSGRTGGWKRKK